MDILTRGTAALLMMAMPIALGAYLVYHYRTGWRLFLIGAAVFVLSQVFHIPFNSYVLDPLMSRLGFSLAAGPGWELAGAAILLGLSAGVFEEGARWLAYRFWIRKARRWKEGVVFGSGHGGGEAFIFGVLSLLTLIQLAALRGQDLSAIVPPDKLAAAQAQVETYWGMPAWAAFLAPFERACTLAIQITLAVIVLQAFIRRGGALWLMAAIGWHALVDAGGVYLGVTNGVYEGSLQGSLLVEGLAAVMALISLWILLRLRRPEPVETPPPAAPTPHSGPLPSGPTPTGRLEDSRFTE